MLTFTDPMKYVMGIGTAYATSLKDGSVVFWSNKYQEGNTTFSATEMVNSGGIGNGPACILYNDPNISVSFTSADYNEFARAAATGADISYGAPVEACQTVTATGTSIAIDVATDTPVAPLGMLDVVCYVQEVGAASNVAIGGIAYKLDPDTGAIENFAATDGKTYLVTYYKTQANATITTFGADFNGDVVRFVYRRPIYTNFNPNTNTGDLYGWLVDIIPYLKLNPATASTNGSQSAFSTTAISGRAIVFDEAIIDGNCEDCTLIGAPLMYSVIVPCDASSGIEGVVGVLGSTVDIVVGNTYQLTPGVVVNGKLSYNTAPSEFTFTSDTVGVASVGEHTGLISGVSAGSAQITISLTEGETTYSDIIDVTVTNS